MALYQVPHSLMARHGGQQAAQMIKIRMVREVGVDTARSIVGRQWLREAGI